MTEPTPQPPVSLKREVARLLVSFGSVAVAIATLVWGWADGHWAHPQEVAVLKAEVDQNSAADARYKIENLRNLYWMRLSLLDRQISYMRMRKNAAPTTWTGVDEAQLETIMQDRADTYQSYIAEQMKPPPKIEK